jgi:hypothetical protein
MLFAFRSTSMNRSRRRRDSSALIELDFKVFFGADVGSETGFIRPIAHNNKMK